MIDDIRDEIKSHVISFTSKYGKPSIIVGSRAYNFAIREVLHNTDISGTCLPEVVWDRQKLFLENVMGYACIILKESV